MLHVSVAQFFSISQNSMCEPSFTKTRVHRLYCKVRYCLCEIRSKNRNFSTPSEFDFFFFVVPTIQVLITYEQVTLNARSYSSCKPTMYRTLAASHGTGKSTVWNGVIWWDCILCTVGTGLMRSVLSIMALHQQLHEC
jgi:hypothetical protein